MAKQVDMYDGLRVIFVEAEKIWGRTEIIWGRKKASKLSCDTQKLAMWENCTQVHSFKQIICFPKAFKLING